MNTGSSNKNVGLILMEEGFITERQHQRAVVHAKLNSVTLHDALVKLGFVTEKEITEAGAKNRGLEFADIDGVMPDSALATVIPYYLARLYTIVPISLNNGILTVAVPLSCDQSAIEDVTRYTWLNVRTVISTRTAIEEAITHLYGVPELDEPVPGRQIFTIIESRGKETEATASRGKSKENPSVTFNVADVEPAVQALPEVRLHELLRFNFLNLEACTDYFNPVVYYGSGNALLQAVYGAFTRHTPLVLSPDMIWLTVLQGLACHINRYPEDMRRHFVTHDSAVELIVRRDDFVLGSFENPWEEVFTEFSGQIRSHITPHSYDLIVSNFSTTGAVERAAQEVVLMDVVQSYFNYVFLCLCGIPSITIEGCTSDWIDIKERTAALSRYGLTWWIEKLLPVLDRFVGASQGSIDVSFWKDIYQRHPEGSDSYGDPLETFSGWIGCFFPYYHNEKNPLLTGPVLPASECGLYLNDFRPCVSKVPVKCLMMDRKGKLFTDRLEFLSGIIAIEQNPETLALRPKIGWLVRKAE